VASAQEKGTEPLEFAHFDCGITQTKQKMDYRLFASTPPIELRINNEKLSYTTFQFGKRKSKIYLYMRILIDNVCIRQDENVDVYFESGEIITLKNEYPLNCNSFFARQMKNRELKKFRENKISMIKIYTYKKNYEHRISDIQNHDIQHYIECLSEYKIKKSNEVKVKKNTKKDEKN
jgi:hypothetical protein